MSFSLISWAISLLSDSFTMESLDAMSLKKKKNSTEILDLIYTLKPKRALQKSELAGQTTHLRKWKSSLFSDTY